MASKKTTKKANVKKEKEVEKPIVEETEIETDPEGVRGTTSIDVLGENSEISDASESDSEIDENAGTTSEDEENSDIQEIEEIIKTFDFQCPKCHTMYSKDEMKEFVAHVILKDEQESVSYYCAPCSVSWLERSAAKLS